MPAFAVCASLPSSTPLIDSYSVDFSVHGSALRSPNLSPDLDSVVASDQDGHGLPSSALRANPGGARLGRTSRASDAVMWVIAAIGFAAELSTFMSGVWTSGGLFGCPGCNLRSLERKKCGSAPFSGVAQESHRLLTLGEVDIAYVPPYCQESACISSLAVMHAVSSHLGKYSGDIATPHSTAFPTRGITSSPHVYFAMSSAVPLAAASKPACSPTV